MNKSIVIQIAIALVFQLSAYTQDLSYGGPVSASLANVRSLDQSKWAILNNASLLSWEKNLSFSASYQMRFNLIELSSRSLSAVVPTKFGVLSGLVLQNGYSKSLYSRYAIAYSRAFGHFTSGFFQYSYMGHHIEYAERSDAFFAALGLNHHISQFLQVGLFIQNPEQAKISYSGSSYALPTLYNIGLSWNRGQTIFIFVEAEKELNHNPVYKAAVQLAFKERLFVRSGIKGKPLEFTFGGGFIVSNLSIDAGFLYHQQLGLSSSIGLSYTLNRSKK